MTIINKCRFVFRIFKLSLIVHEALFFSYASESLYFPLLFVLCMNVFDRFFVCVPFIFLRTMLDKWFFFVYLCICYVGVYKYVYENDTVWIFVYIFKFHNVVDYVYLKMNAVLGSYQLGCTFMICFELNCQSILFKILGFYLFFGVLLWSLRAVWG